jgi:hypothetical protein
MAEGVDARRQPVEAEAAGDLVLEVVVPLTHGHDEMAVEVKQAGRRPTRDVMPGHGRPAAKDAWRRHHAAAP